MKKNDYLLDKWYFMLISLNQKKSNQLTYAKMFESVSLKSNTNMAKLVLSLLLKILYYIPDLKFSLSHKNKIFISSIDKELVIDGFTIMPDGAHKFIDDVVKIVQKKYNSGELIKLNSIQLINNNNLIEINIIF